ncbi:MAG: DUF924 domain-containing protein [Betaproteobacteria bacterium]|nr:DUF924 domain-containing protein [Betaproteobacteria bacterium]
MDFSEVLDFWFGAPSARQRGRQRVEWFRKNALFDEEIRRRFLGEHEAALAGLRGSWEATPHAALALVIMLDQFPRNLFRGSPNSFAADSAALGVARRMVERGFDRLLRPIERCFVYLPFEHCETLAAQRRSLALFEGLRFSSDCGGNIDYAYRHYDVIARFGRFPHRNSVLGRPSTSEEIEYIKQPGSGF